MNIGLLAATAVGLLWTHGNAAAGESLQWLRPAWAKIQELQQKSPSAEPEHVSVCNRYHIVDLDHDGIGEVLEYVPHYRCSGFLNGEIGPAFDWVNVFAYRDGSYRAAHHEFADFNQGRRYHYELWLRLFEDPSVLGTDSRSLVSRNRSEFQRVLRGLVERLRLPPRTTRTP